MGTNYYLYSKNKKAMQSCFGEYGDFELTDNPDFGYKRHIGKTSCGWKPILQMSNRFKTFNELKEVYKTYDFKIIDEYGRMFDSFDDFEKHLIEHLKCLRKTPYKWVEKENEFDPQRKLILALEECSEDEAEIYEPIDHLEYQTTYLMAQRKYKRYDRFDFERSIRYSHDPNYDFNWTEGDFS